jgi:hypothetical protein
MKKLITIDIDKYGEDLKEVYDFKIFSGWINYHGDINATGNCVNLYEDFKQNLKIKYDLTIEQVVYLPIYVYSHSGETFNTTGFECEWDSGQLGYIFYTKKEIKEWYGAKRISSKLKEKIEEKLKNDVKIFDASWNGQYFSYSITDESNDVLDSCSGFLCVDNDFNSLAKNMIEYMDIEENEFKLEEIESKILEVVY